MTWGITCSNQLFLLDGFGIRIIQRHGQLIVIQPLPLIHWILDVLQASSHTHTHKHAGAYKKCVCRNCVCCVCVYLKLCLCVFWKYVCVFLWCVSVNYESLPVCFESFCVYASVCVCMCVWACVSVCLGLCACVVCVWNVLCLCDYVCVCVCVFVYNHLSILSILDSNLSESVKLKHETCDQVQFTS